MCLEPLRMNSASYDRVGEIPELFRTHFREFVDAGGYTHPSGLSVSVSLANSLEMRSHSVKLVEQIEVILDWSILERVLMLGKFAWGMNGERLWYQKIGGFLEQEIFLIAARSAVCAQATTIAEHYQNRYGSYEFAAQISHRIDLEGQLREALWYVEYMIYAELGRLACVENPDMAKNVVHTIFDAADIADAALSADDIESLFIADYGLRCVIQSDRSAVKRGFLYEMILFFLYDDLLRVVQFIAPFAEGFSEHLQKRMDFALKWDRSFRWGLIRGRCLHLADATQNSDIAAELRSGAEMVNRLQDMLENVLVNGLPKLHYHYYYDSGNLNDFILKTMQKTMEDDAHARTIRERIAGFVDDEMRG